MTGLIRLAVPPAVAEAIARQREALSARTRSRAAKAAAADRKARGIVPAFLSPENRHPAKRPRSPAARDGKFPAARRRRRKYTRRAPAVAPVAGGPVQ